MDIYTIGGGEIIWEVLNAVARCLNGGGNLLRALMMIGGVSGAFIIYFVLLYGNVEAMMKTWALPVVAMMNLFFVPVTTVWVHDDVSVFHRKLDNVPYGLAVFASNFSKIGKVITEKIETNFSTPDDLKYQKTGMMFGSDILERAKDFKIVNQNFRENMKNFVGQCVKYDIMLNNKYTFDDLRNSSDIWELITRSPSNNRGIFWIPIAGGRSRYVTCSQAAKEFESVWKQEIARVSLGAGLTFFSGRAIGHSNLQGNQFRMTEPLQQVLKNELLGNVQSTYSYLGGLAQSAEEMLKQNVMVNAMRDSSSENSRNAGNPISYSEMKALMQQRYTYETLGRLAAKVLPIMKAVIEALVYACFIFIIPLCMIPSGYKFLFNWAATLIWLQAWPPMYAILNFIMNIAARSSTMAEIGMAGGITIANSVGVSEANADMKTLAGYLALSIPFLCIAIVKGVGTFVHLASQLTGTTSQAGASAAGEITSGNFSYGNVSQGNSQFGNLSQLQRSYSSSLATGSRKIDTGNVQITNSADGSAIINEGYSTGRTSAMASSGNSEAREYAQQQSIQQSQDAHKMYSKESSIAQTNSSNLSNMFSNSNAASIAQRTGLSVDRAEQFQKDDRYLQEHNAGRHYTEGTNATANVSGNIGGGIDFKKTAGGNGGSPNTGSGDNSASTNVAAVGFNIGGSFGVGGGAHADNITNHGDTRSAATSENYDEVRSRHDSAIKDIAASSNDEEVKKLAQDYTSSNSKAESYREQENYHRQQSESFNDSYRNSSSIGFNTNDNLRDAGIEIAEEKYGMSKLEASKMLDSRNPEDMQKRNEVFRIANDRATIRPQGITAINTMPFDGESSLKSKFAASEKVEQSYQEAHKHKIYAKTGALNEKRGNTIAKSDITIGRDSKEIAQNAASLKNKQDAVRQKVEKRAEDGAAVSAIKHAKNTFFGDKKDG